MIAGVCLLGLAGCSCEPDIPDWYNINHSLGITLSELVEEMNQIDETLNLDLSTLERYPVEIADSPCEPLGVETPSFYFSTKTNTSISSSLRLDSLLVNEGL